MTAREARLHGAEPARPDTLRTPFETTSAAQDPQTLSPERDRIVRAALESVGDTATDLDCSAFVQSAYATVGFVLPRTVREQFEAGLPVTDEELRPGDLLFFAFERAPVDHVGIYLGQERFAHVSSTARAVRIDALGAAPFAVAMVAGRRFLP